MPKSKEYLSTSSSTDSDSESEPRPKKKKVADKKAEKKKAKKSKAPKSSDEELDSPERLIELAPMRYAGVNIFKGRKYVNIREYYRDNEGEIKPGRKGISLNEAQWKTLKEGIDDLDDALNSL